MAAETPIWIGSTDVRETKDSPDISVDATRFSITRVYEGPYEKCVSGQPEEGQSFPDMPAAVMITRVRVQKLAGGIGRITVTAETSGPSEDTPFAPTYEIEWRPVEKKIETHSRYADGTDGTTAGPKALTFKDRSMIQQWEQEDNFVLRAQFKYKHPQDSNNQSLDGITPSGSTDVNGVRYDIYTLTDNAQDLAKKKLKGIDSYRVFYPVARATTQSRIVPQTNPCNVRGTPAVQGIPAGYKWISSAWRGTKTGTYGKWEQQLEWEGNDDIDPDLYPET